jgi:beta-N-acetylhexosaminidase
MLLNQKQRTAALKLTGIATLCLCSTAVLLLLLHPSGQRARVTGFRSPTSSMPAPVTATGSRSVPARWSSSAYQATDGDSAVSLPPAPGEIKLSRLVGQLIMAGMDGSHPDAELLRQARDGETGGVLLFSRNVGPDLPAAIKALQDAARQGDGPPLLISIDQEGGAVTRLPGPPRSPRQMDNESQALSEGAATATLLAGTHVNVDLAPVADVITPGGFEAGQGRGFNGGSDRVATLASAFARGLQQGRVAATAKHFPGIGSLALDTDNYPGQLQLSPPALQDQLVPFRRLIDDGVDLVMIANAVCPVWDADRPAVFSHRVVDGLLRQQLGFGGVVITDDLEARSLQGDLGMRAVQAVEAGADVVLFSSAAAGRAAYQALLAAAESGRLSVPRLLESYHRLQALKAKLAS